jgi:transcriptional regulator with AAA-type ATPase domain
VAELDVLVADGCQALVLAHLDDLPAAGVQALADLFTEWQAAGVGGAPWVGVTLRGGRDSANRPGGSPELDAWLLPFFPHTVEVPPLRRRVEDLVQIVPHLLARHARGRELRCSPACLRQLMRLPWPGNLRELDRVLAQVVQTRRSGVVEVDDLPPECRAVTRRQLSQLESIERDAIVRSLDVNGGNKEKAAADLGMSRATIYRKIRAFGIAPPPSA